MKFLGFIFGGVVLGYVIGLLIGDSTAVKEAGWLTFLIGDYCRAQCACQCAVFGGIIGTLSAIFI